MTRAELIAALEATTEPSRKLDQEIYLEIVGFAPGLLPMQWPDIGTPPSPFPQYTASLDAALTLVPKGMAADIHVGPHDMLSEAEVTEPIRHPVAADGSRTTTWKTHEAPVARIRGTLTYQTAAIALCIAALRARGDA